MIQWEKKIEYESRWIIYVEKRTLHKEESKVRLEIKHTITEIKNYLMG